MRERRNEPVRRVRTRRMPSPREGFVAVCLGITLLVPSQGFGLQPNPCVTSDGKPIVDHAQVTLTCRDGDPRCDVDGRCDGLCRIAACFESPIVACTPPSVSFCPGGGALIHAIRSKDTAHVDSAGGFQIDTSLDVRCRPARRGCPRKRSCRAVVSGGAKGKSKRCWVWVDFGGAEVDLLVEAPGLSASARLEFPPMRVASYPSGSYSLGQGFEYVSGLLTTRSASFGMEGASYPLPYAHGSVRLDLSSDLAVPLSGYGLGEPHGTLSATFTDTQGRPPAQLDLRF